MITNYPALRQLDICLEIWLYPLRLMAIMGSVQAVVALTFERFSAITRRVWERGGEGGDGLNHRSQLLQVLDLHGTTSLQVFSPRHHFYSHLRSGIQCSEIFRTYLSLRAEYFRIKTRTAQFIIQNLSNLPSSLPPPHSIRNKHANSVLVVLFCHFDYSRSEFQWAVNKVQC